TAYELSVANAINKTTNVKRFSGIAAIVAVSLIIVVRTKLFGVWHLTAEFFIALKDLLIKIIEWVVYPLAYGMSYLVNLINVLRLEGEEMPSIMGAFDRGERLVDYDLFVEEYPIPPALELALTIVAWTLLIILSMFMIANVYKKVSQVRQMPEIPGTEERIFIFDELNPFRKKSKTRQKSEDKKLSITRLRYKNALTSYKEKGYEKPISLTPNEYFDHLKSADASDESFETLTGAYNRVRYGDQKDS
ncbi:MAG TPA: hypothetical protein DCS67_07315, partial [Clostridiales bacterium UBA8960]|nr:hypothetical protein [Clostridiales bacterium UBA8960]